MPFKGQKIADNPKDHTLQVRMDKDTMEALDSLSEIVGVSRAAIVRRGIMLQYEEEQDAIERRDKTRGMRIKGLKAAASTLSAEDAYRVRFGVFFNSISESVVIEEAPKKTTVAQMIKDGLIYCGEAFGREDYNIDELRDMIEAAVANPDRVE